MSLRLFSYTIVSSYMVVSRGLSEKQHFPLSFTLWPNFGKCLFYVAFSSMMYCYNHREYLLRSYDMF